MHMVLDVALSLGIALPSWLVSEGSSSVVLLVYGLVFGVGLPIMVVSWHPQHGWCPDEWQMTTTQTQSNRQGGGPRVKI